jgi:hypothetical protein
MIAYSLSEELIECHSNHIDDAGWGNDAKEGSFIDDIEEERWFFSQMDEDVGPNRCNPK